MYCPIYRTYDQFLQSVTYNDNEADIIDESEADTEISEDEDAVISGDDQKGNSIDID